MLQGKVCASFAVILALVGPRGKTLNASSLILQVPHMMTEVSQNQFDGPRRRHVKCS